MITVADFIDAVEENGLPKIQGRYFRREPRIQIGSIKFGEITTGGCAFGQAARNLRFPTEFLAEQAGKIIIRLDSSVARQYNYLIDSSLWERTTFLNDSTELTLPEIAAQLRIEFESKLNTVLVG